MREKNLKEIIFTKIYSFYVCACICESTVLNVDYQCSLKYSLLINNISCMIMKVNIFLTHTHIRFLFSCFI